MVVALAVSLAYGGRTPEGFALFDGRVPFEFVLFVLTLLGVALFHHHTLEVAGSGLVAVTAYKILFVGSFHLGNHLIHEWQIVVNLFGLLVGFAILAKHFEESEVPKWIPRILPDREPWGGIVLLAYVWILSAFLDNIAAAMIGGVIARSVFRGVVTVGFLAAMVAASNAGGAWSVVGDTTTTMMWIAGVPASGVLSATLASAAAFVVLAFFAARQQAARSPVVVGDRIGKVHIDGTRLAVVALILVGAVSANVFLDFPAAGVWGAIILGAFLRKPDWKEVPPAAKGACFLLSLVLCASMMPVKALPDPDWKSTLALGFVSAAFDNIPLTKLAIDQGGYDWSLLAFAVGFGGSMIWFGSSAGVAVSKDYPEARNVLRWLKDGWFVAPAYVVGFFAMFLSLGWNPAPIPADFSVGEEVEDVVLELLPEGEWTEEQARGKTTVLVFTDTESEEHEDFLKRLQEFSLTEDAEGVTVLGVLHDTPRSEAMQTVREDGITIPVACEQGHRNFEHFRRHGYAHTAVLDSNCRVAYSGDGFDLNGVRETVKRLRRAPP
ncbi:MAG TPA: citrate transporter [Planctomycetota bacterium]|nr:citrate transporter [Planctomycetota bacterium]